jgi:hypothetical protein
MDSTRRSFFGVLGGLLGLPALARAAPPPAEVDDLFDADDDWTPPPAPEPSPGTVRRWTGDGDGRSWDDPRNWKGGVLPRNGDALFIDSGGPMNVPADVVSLESVTLGRNSRLGWDLGARATLPRLSPHTVRPTLMPHRPTA